MGKGVQQLLHSSASAIQGQKYLAFATGGLAHQRITGAGRIIAAASIGRHLSPAEGVYGVGFNC